MATADITPIRPFDEEAALAWIRAQPGARTSLSDAELGRRWGWKRQRVGRRVKAWAKEGRITRRGNAITCTDAHVTEDAGPATVVPPPVPPLVPSVVPPRRAKDVRPPIASKVDVQAPGRRHGRGTRFATLTAALGLAIVSGGFSITGMTAVFVGATLPVIGMGVALELGKLAAVAALPTLRGGALKTALVALVAVLMGLNAIGAYGFLAKAHIGHQVEGETVVAGRTANVNARLALQTSLVSDLDRRIGQIDGAVEKATSKGRTAAAMALADQQRKTRGELVGQRLVEAKVLAALQVEKAQADGERRKVEADLGPVRYLATLLGAGDQDVLRWFILVVALLLDPAAVLLLLAATRRA